MEHSFFECMITSEPCTTPYCPWCDGGLVHCTVCMGTEGTLPSSCPGTPISDTDQQLIFEGMLNYQDGTWVSGAHTPHPKPFEIAAALVRLNLPALDG